jgi:cytoskeletal protein CcmA (bactofilin family)
MNTKILRGQIKGDLIVTEHSEISDLVDGNVTVKPNIRLKISGMVKGDIFMEKGSEVAIMGFVSGSVANSGGSLVVFGKVAGEVSAFSPEISMGDKEISKFGGGG